MDNVLSSVYCSPPFEQLRLGIRFKQVVCLKFKPNSLRLKLELKYCVRYDWVI